MKKLLLGLLIVLISVVLWAHYSYLPRTAQRMNAILNPGPYKVSEQTKALHQRLRVADLHADSLLWSRDLNQRETWGHVDVPRLQEGNVAVQAFTIVSKTPRGQNIESNRGDTDEIRLLAFASFWPVSTWFSPFERALYQARRLEYYAAASGGMLTVIKSRDDFNAFLERRKANPQIVAGFLGIEGAHALEGKLENFLHLYEAGFRMIGLAHFFDNEFAGSAHGEAKYGLTEQGRTLVKQMLEHKVFIDLAHCSPKVIDDVLEVATRPVFVSHSGVKGTCNNNRNLSDDQLKRISLNGGVIGIGFWDTATCGNDAQAIAKSIRHAVRVAGIDHVALGSDYDGAIAAPFDASGMALITEALMQENFSEAEIEKIMGENVIRMLQFNLP